MLKSWLKMSLTTRMVTRPAVEQLRRAGRFGLASMLSHCADKRRCVAGPSSDALGRRAHDNLPPGITCEDLLEAGPLLVGQLALILIIEPPGTYTSSGRGGSYPAGQPGALVPDRILGHLHQDRLAGLEGGLDPLDSPRGRWRRNSLVRYRPRCALADVDEGGLHRGSTFRTLPGTRADERLRLALSTKCSMSTPSSSTPITDALAALPDHHELVHRLAPGEEPDSARSAGAADLSRGPPAALALGLQPGGSWIG